MEEPKEVKTLDELVKVLDEKKRLWEEAANLLRAQCSECGTKFHPLELPSAPMKLCPECGDTKGTWIIFFDVG